ncbi:MAG: PDZ domain-containing protein [Planctomycetaceae bacterium]
MRGRFCEQPGPSDTVVRRSPRGCLVCITWLLLAVISGGGTSAQDSLILKEERAFKEAATLAAPSIVRIETVGGRDIVGELLTGTGPTTGVVVDAGGYIITSSFNFIASPSGIVVTLPDDRRFPASVVASDSSRMLTLLKIELGDDASPLIPLQEAPRDSFRVGQWAIAAGRTYDAGFPNLAVGIVSAVDRVWGRALQTDASISPANYGGPLLDIEGRGLGILVPLAPDKTEETAGVEWYDGGIGFAIPLEDVYGSLDRLKAGENLKAGLMGVGFPDQSVLAGEAKINQVRPESPADKAGLHVDDIIVAAAGQPVARVPDLRHILGRMYAGDRVPLEIRRGDETINVEVELAAELTAYESAYLGILPARLPVGDDSSGVTIREVLPDSPAAAAGLQRRERILAINGTTVANSGELLSIIARLLPGTNVELLVSGESGERTVSAELASLPDTVPETLAAASIPAPAEAALPLEKLGRQTGTLAENSERQFWRYVPDQYHPDYAYGLLVWLHPAGDTMERTILQLWQAECDRRGIILVAPKAADIGSWISGETEFVKDLIEQTSGEYRVDPARIVLHGHAEGGTFAWEAGFKHRDLVRAISTSSAALRELPPDNDPDLRTHTAIVVGADDPLLPKVERSAEILRTLEYPTQTITVPGHGDEYPPAATIEELARWIDLLDRI